MGLAAALGVWIQAGDDGGQARGLCGASFLICSWTSWTSLLQDCRDCPGGDRATGFPRETRGVTECPCSGPPVGIFQGAPPASSPSSEGREQENRPSPHLRSPPGDPARGQGRGSGECCRVCRAVCPQAPGGCLIVPTSHSRRLGAGGSVPGSGHPARKGRAQGRPGLPERAGWALCILDGWVHGCPGTTRDPLSCSKL